ncbi:putative metal-binding motif-containing protein [Sphingomicrobium nitratireducens]|uniref:putative metal-binding motif-containing protein n=1 Tax=Sphingomicrobium nitratireducens TaxID=2964666 RepID=UPI00223FD498|nr:putative metal-binding motif-containing protein [Sphingomicrobium nitratireducens]
MFKRLFAVAMVAMLGMTAPAATQVAKLPAPKVTVQKPTTVVAPTLKAKLPPEVLQGILKTKINAPTKVAPIEAKTRPNLPRREATRRGGSATPWGQIYVLAPSDRVIHYPSGGATTIGLAGPKYDGFNVEVLKILSPPENCDTRCKQVVQYFNEKLAAARWVDGETTIEPSAQIRGMCPSRTDPNCARDPLVPAGALTQATRIGLEQFLEEGLQRATYEMRVGKGRTHAYSKPNGLTVLDPDTIHVEEDADGDGVEAIEAGGSDCDDTDSNRFPGNPEVADAEGHDEDCDVSTIGDVDQDNDGFISMQAFNVHDDGVHETRGTDCNDRNLKVNPMAIDFMNNYDDDCDGTVDEDDPASPSYIPPDAY